VAIEIWQQQAFESLGMVFVLNNIDTHVIAKESEKIATT